MRGTKTSISQRFPEKAKVSCGKCNNCKLFGAAMQDNGARRRELEDRLLQLRQEILTLARILKCTDPR